MKNRYDLLIIGATFAGLGAALAAGERAVVLERTALAGHEFINCYHPGVQWLQTALSPEGERLKRELLDRKILSPEGKIHLPALAPLLYAWIGQNRLPVLLMTEISAIQRTADGFAVEIYHNSGFNRFHVRRILDTTTYEAAYRPRGMKITSKSINAVLSGGTSLPSAWNGNGDFTFMEGKQAGEVFLKMKAAEAEDWISARHRLHQSWANRPEDMKMWTIAAVSEDFEITAVNEGVQEPGWEDLPSSSFRNPLEAFEAGLQFVQKEGWTDAVAAKG